MFTSACSRAVQTCSSGWLPVGQLDADQVAFDQRQAGPFQDFAALLGMAEQEPHEGAFGRIVDRQGHDPDVAPLEAADDFEQLADAVFQKHRELADRRIVPAAHRGKAGAGSFADAHTGSLRSSEVAGLSLQTAGERGESPELPEL